MNLPIDTEQRGRPGAKLVTALPVRPRTDPPPPSSSVHGIASRTARIPDLYHDAAWLRRVSLVAALVAAFAATVEGALWLSSRDPGNLGVALSAAALAAWLLVVGRRIADGRERWGVAMMSAGAFGAVVVMVSVIPDSAPILALSMLVPLFLAIPYLGSRDLARYSVGVWVAALALVVVAGSIRATSGSGSDVMTRLVRDLLATGTIMALVMVLLNRYHAAVAALRRMALHDGLTDLYSRELFVDRLEHALARQRSGRRTGTATAVVYIDLDDFKRINDLHGHAHGDRVLRAVAARLRESVRGTDTVARVGGDEFAVLLEEVADRAEAATLRRRVTSALTQPLAFTDGAQGIDASVGLAFSDEGIETAETLLDDADRAMYQAKGEARRAGMVHAPSGLARIRVDADVREVRRRRSTLAPHPSRLMRMHSAIQTPNTDGHVLEQRQRAVASGMDAGLNG